MTKSASNQLSLATVLFSDSLLVEHQHWIDRWEDGRIGFHQDKINPWLEKFLPNLFPQSEPQQDKKILLPLCGKSLDLVWLAEKGFTSIGVELSSIATNAFFEEQNLTPTISSIGDFKKFQNSRITILEGDFFQLASNTLGECKAVFDRAALVALPDEMRKLYAEHLTNLISQGGKILLVTTEFPQQQKTPPPFSVSQKEVESLYQKHCDIELLHSEDLSATRDPLTERGVTSLVEKIYLLTKR